VTVLKEGGHIAEILDKRSAVNPLWIPPWPSIEPSIYDPQKHPEYGTATDAKLLAGIMGHNLCLDMFGGPSEEEFQAGITPHGEGSVVPYEITEEFGSAVYLKSGAEFEWPNAPRSDGGIVDLRVFNNAPVSSGYTAHSMDPSREHAFFTAFSPTFKFAIAYVWRQRDFPWMGIWEENHSRTNPPWNGKTLTRGMEFGVSPMPESRREMTERGRLFGIPAYRWLPARSRIEVEYEVIVRRSESMPEFDAP
jgi:hypothetical protein